MVVVNAHETEDGIRNFVEILSRFANKTSSNKLYFHMEDEEFIFNNKPSEPEYESLIEEGVCTLKDLIKWETEQLIEFEYVNIKDYKCKYNDKTYALKLNIYSDNDKEIVKMFKILSAIVNPGHCFVASLNDSATDRGSDEVVFEIDGDGEANIDYVYISDDNSNNNKKEFVDTTSKSSKNNPFKNKPSYATEELIAKKAAEWIKNNPGKSIDVAEIILMAAKDYEY